MKEKNRKESEKYTEAEMRVDSSLPTGEAVEWHIFRMQLAACHNPRKTYSAPQKIQTPRPQDDTWYVSKCTLLLTHTVGD